MYLFIYLSASLAHVHCMLHDNHKDNGGYDNNNNNDDDNDDDNNNDDNNNDNDGSKL